MNHRDVQPARVLEQPGKRCRPQIRPESDEERHGEQRGTRQGERKRPLPAAPRCAAALPGDLKASGGCDCSAAGLDGDGSSGEEPGALALLFGLGSVIAVRRSRSRRLPS